MVAFINENIVHRFPLHFSTGVIIFLMVNMMSIIVVMANILIGQISYRYTLAQTQARIQNHIDRTKWVTRIESSLFKSRVSQFKVNNTSDFSKYYVTCNRK